MKDWRLRGLDRIENVGFILLWHTAFGMTPVLSKAGGQCGCFGMEQVFCELRCMGCEHGFLVPGGGSPV